MSLADDVARLTAIVVRMHQAPGMTATRLRIAAGLDLSQVGKAAGVDAATVAEWEAGRAMPSGTGQALAWLSHVSEAAGWRGPPADGQAARNLTASEALR